MANPDKQRAKVEAAEARAETDRAAVRAKAQKKIKKIEQDLRAEEARIDAKLAARRKKAEAKLTRAWRSRSGARRSSGRRAERAAARNAKKR